MNAPAPWPERPFGERRNPLQFPARQALVRLRLAEFLCAEHLPTGLMQELTAAIDGVIDLLRAQP